MKTWKAGGAWVDGDEEEEVGVVGAVAAAGVTEPLFICS